MLRVSVELRWLMSYRPFDQQQPIDNDVPDAGWAKNRYTGGVSRRYSESIRSGSIGEDLSAGGILSCGMVEPEVDFDPLGWSLLARDVPPPPLFLERRVGGVVGFCMRHGFRWRLVQIWRGRVQRFQVWFSFARRRIASAGRAQQ